MAITIEQMKQAYPIFPKDVPLLLPTESSLPLQDQHFLIYIPWQEDYLDLIPEQYRDFFTTILPYLAARTTDVHTAVCMSYLDEFIGRARETGKTVNRDVLAYALMLHDCGWSRMTQEEIAASLGVSGLVLSDTAMAPKEKHAVLGAEIAEEILREKKSELGLTDADIELIGKAIRYHDKPELVAGSQEEMPIEVQLLVDLDHLWSFTHLNFWQDVLRKGVAPQEYLHNLSADLEGYFVTTIGKEKARALLTEREKEVRGEVINDGLI